ncbi:amidohydrolase [Halobacillus shinanisalinarum]|uniref:Amidohydrolase n=1 Tax=Halobacillus shinanisalinarum TaxID=2932258 RepID=A0ABY4H3F2_9BACI|nr:amidohydrolase [Halobacillus shinanisalinarum]UOQ94649.1 amidohydrolase [Halobacillus shinanisalinarum]
MSRSDLLQWIEQNQDKFTEIAQNIWDNPQLAYEEKYASNLQMTTLKEAGFRIENPVGDVNTAFVAEFGSGKPIIGVLGEFDALPGLSQKAGFTQEEVVPNGPGHGCGHNLLGTAGVEAVIALKEKMTEEDLSGTIRYYGCPAEEVLAGKTHMAKAGVFDDLDCALTWHPGNSNTVMNMSMQAMVSIKFHFKGITAHAAAAPHAGRSALDGVELMNVGTNYLREHVPDGTRIHYVITNGGLAPNIVPEAASVWYYIRASSKNQVEDILTRVKNIAKGAALMTETEVEHEVSAFPYDTLPNDSLNELMFSTMQEGSLPSFTEEEQSFAERLVETIKSKNTTGTFGNPVDELLPTNFSYDKQLAGKSIQGSTDVGDVSYITPTGMISTTCAPVGVQLHSWQATASFGTSIGYQGMHLAAKTMSLTAYDLLLNRNNILERAKEEFNERSEGKKYVAGI